MVSTFSLALDRKFSMNRYYRNRMVYTVSLVLQDYSKGTDTTGTERYTQFLLFYKIIPREQILQEQNGIHSFSCSTRLFQGNRYYRNRTVYTVSLVLQDYSKGTDTTGTERYTQFLLLYKIIPREQILQEQNGIHSFSCSTRLFQGNRYYRNRTVYTVSLVLQDYSKGTDTTGTERYTQFLLFYKIIPREQILQEQNGIHSFSCSTRLFQGNRYYRNRTVYTVSLVLQDYSKGTDTTGTEWYTQFLLLYKIIPREQILQEQNGIHSFSCSTRLNQGNRYYRNSMVFTSSLVLDHKFAVNSRTLR